MIPINRSSLMLVAIGVSIALTAILHTWTVASSCPPRTSLSMMNLSCPLSAVTPNRNKHKKQTLPVRNENGLIIVFIHIPKTGGTSTRAALSKASDEFLFGLGEEACRKHVDTMYRQLSNWTPGKFLLFELHTLTCPPYMAHRHHLEAWRNMAAFQEIPFFAFSMVREPYSNAVSWYSYYFGPVGFNHELTEDDFKDSLVHNVQSLFLARSEQAYRHKELRIGYSRQEFETVAKYFLQDMDWIGTLEQQSTETIPLLNRVTNMKLNFEHKNESPDSFGKTNVTEATKEWVLEENAWDIELYQQAQARFPINMWETSKRRG
ncbi:hypothetical protein MPSEU_000406000 [Mayamaea pseudoterrestris]|nr:hypothetical protein MPSEU_000406000 [Mayamaea pseudoterrestris]